MISISSSSPIKTLLLLLLFIHHSHYITTHAQQIKKPRSIALCAAIKEKTHYILDWIDYHAALGISTFYLMDTDNPHHTQLSQALDTHIQSGLVELYHLPRVTPQTINLLQVKLYKACLDGVRHKHQFIGFWDVDEYLIPMNTTSSLYNDTSSNSNSSNNENANNSTTTMTRSLVDYLIDKYIDVGGLAINWRIVGPSGHIHDPRITNNTDSNNTNNNNSTTVTIPSTVLHYTQCTPWTYHENQEIKTIVNTDYALHPTTDPHSFIYKNGYHAVDAYGKKVDGTKNHAVHDMYVQSGAVPRFALYHYVTRSWEEYQEKMRKGSAMGNRKNEEYFRKIEKLAVERCVDGIDAYREAVGRMRGER